MSKKDKNAPLDGQTPQEQPGEVTEEYRQEDAGETFTVTREQMEKMEKLAGEMAALSDIRRVSGRVTATASTAPMSRHRA